MAKKRENKVELAAAATVRIHDAINTASEKVPATVIEAELEKKHNTLIWEDEIVTPEHKVMEVHIDAKTGVVIEVEEKKEKSGRLKRPRL